MTDVSLEIAPCPPELTREALSLVLGAIAPEQRREVARDVFDAVDIPARAVDGLFVAQRGGKICGAVWRQRQPGNTAVLWAPQWDETADAKASVRLIRAAVESLEAAGASMTQTLLPSRDSDAAPALHEAGFHHLAELLYLTSEGASFPSGAPEQREVELEPYQPGARERLARLIERTYEGTLDCAELNGARRTDDVLDGYAATGCSGTSEWYILRAKDEDVGVLLLAEHTAARHWELVYVGMTPEARRQRLGTAVTRHAQWLAREKRIERIVLAVDAANLPALKMYQRCGFVTWDRRSVFVRIPAGSENVSPKT